jgi:hypothetical protein
LAQSLKLKGALSLKEPQQKSCPAVSDGGGEKSDREIKQSQGVRDPWKFHRPQINPCSMSPTTQQVQHSSYRRIKSMPFTRQRDIKVIYI